MPVPDTYSRRSVREESYTFSTRSSRPSSYLSNYTSKYSSTLPPRPPLYERKISELNTSSTTGSRFLNGSSRAGSTYGSSYVRSSVSPVRATSSLRRNLEGSTTSSITDRLRALELSGEKESIYKFTRNRDKDRDTTSSSASSSAVGGGIGSTTTAKTYGSSSYGRDRDRSGSRELGSSPLTSSPITLASRDRVSDNNITRSRSSSTTGGGSPGSAGRTATTTTTTTTGSGSRSTNGVMSRLGTYEVNKSSVVSSESTSSSATPTNSVVSKNEGDDVDSSSRDVENNDEGSSSSSSAVDSSASSSSSPPSVSKNNDEVSLKNMNGNDTVEKDDGTLTTTSANYNDDDKNKNNNTTTERKKSVGFQKIESPPTTNNFNVDQQDSNGNPINVVNNHDQDDYETSVLLLPKNKDHNSYSNYTSSSSSASSSSRNNNNRSSFFSSSDKNNHLDHEDDNSCEYSPQTVPSSTSDSNANLVTEETVIVKNKKSVGGGLLTAGSKTCGVSAATTTDRDLTTTATSIKKSSSGVGVGGQTVEIGVKKSLLKPNNLSSTSSAALSKVQTKSKIIIHKFAVEDATPSPPPSSSSSTIEVSPERGITTSKTIIKTPATATTTVSENCGVSLSSSSSINNNNNYSSSNNIISSRKSPENNYCREEEPSDGSTTSASFTIVRKNNNTNNNFTSGEKRHSNGTIVKLPSSSATNNLSTQKNETTTTDDDNDQEIAQPQQSVEFVIKNKRYGSSLLANSSSPSSSSSSSSSASASASDSERKVVVVPSVPIKRESTSPFKDEELARVKIAKNQHQASTSRSPSPATTTTTATTNTNNHNNTTTSTSTYKAPTPPPLPQLHNHLSSSSPPPKPKNVVGTVSAADEMAGPHSSKYSSPHQGKTTDQDRSSSDRSDRTRNHAYANTSDSSASDNDSEGYSPQVGGRFRTRESSEKSGLTGLRNIGNTCFMNSVLQCLSNTRPLLEYILQESYEINTTTSSMKGALIRAFSQVIQELWRETRTVDTSAFKDQIQRFAPRFMGYSQQDAQEFLRYLLEGLHEDVNRVTIKPKPIITDIDDSLSLTEKLCRKLKEFRDTQKAAESWKRYLRYDDSKIVDIFVGQLKSTLKCTTCGHCSVTFDPFWDLSLPIPARSNQIKLSSCFELFTREEILDGDEKPTCSKCQCRRKCTKSLSIQKFPKILVVHLKRFSPTERYRGKLSTTVEYPIKGLDLSTFAANPGQTSTNYNLYGLSNHSGSTYSGHYVAYCKHPYSGEWHCYNDSRVSSVSSHNIVSSEGYVLFYESATQSSHS